MHYNPTITHSNKNTYRHLFSKSLYSSTQLTRLIFGDLGIWASKERESKLSFVATFILWKRKLSWIKPLHDRLLRRGFCYNNSVRTYISRRPQEEIGIIYEKMHLVLQNTYPPSVGCRDEVTITGAWWRSMNVASIDSQLLTRHKPCKSRVLKPWPMCGDKNASRYAAVITGQ